jgi:hypothetical protein
MPLLLNTSAVIMCSHGGKVNPIPTQMQVLAGGSPVLCVPSLVGAPIIGCPVVPTPAGTVPCTAVAAVFPGSWSTKVFAGGSPAYVSSLSGLTNGVPPGSIMVVSPGQAVVQG